MGVYMADVFSMEDQRRLELGLSIRERIMVELTKDGKLPNDESSREFLLRAIEGVDTTILKRSKIRSEDKLQEAQNQISSNIAELLRRVTVSKNSQGTIENTTIDNNIKVDNPVPGETEIGISSQRIKEEVLSKQ